MAIGVASILSVSVTIDINENKMFDPQPKFQIPAGILQNSEFCLKLLHISPELHPAVLFFIFTRPEPMNLD